MKFPFPIFGCNVQTFIGQIDVTRTSYKITFVLNFLKFIIIFLISGFSEQLFLNGTTTTILRFISFFKLRLGASMGHLDFNSC